MPTTRVSPCNSGTQSWKQTFDYDRYGNREFDGANTTTLANDDKIENPEIEASNNRIKKDQDGGGNDYDYDKNGNLTLDAENKRMVYDAENRIKEFFRGTNGGSTPDATYQYDGNGKRVRKTADGEETIFVYNAGGQLVAEYSTQISTTPEVSYLTADHLGSPRIVTDALGQVRSRHDYLAYGDEVTDRVGQVAGRTSGQGYGEEDDVRKQYTGYERDEESGLDFAQARYYNPSHGRYTGVDPLTASASVKNPQTFNRYTYVLNSPYKFTDPLGLISSNTGANGQFSRGSQGGGYNGGTVFDSLDGRGYSDSAAQMFKENARKADFGKADMQLDDEELKKTDEELSELLTDTGFVVGASAAATAVTDKDGNQIDSHFDLADTTLHTVHIFANENADSDAANVYVPKGFTDVKITSEDTVVARNPKTGVVILIAHVQVGEASRANLKKLRLTMKTTKENGSMLIGRIAGKGGNTETQGKKQYLHAHLSIFPSEASRIAAYHFKKNRGARSSDYNSEIKQHLSDFRELVK